MGRNRSSKSKIVLSLWLLLSFGISLATHAQTLQDLRIGDDASRWSKLGAPCETDNYEAFKVRKWCLANGNELSVTTNSDGKIVYIESDWGGRSSETASDLHDLTFGNTTLGELRKRFGNNGFYFKDRGGVIDIPNGIAMINSYEVGTNIVTFITKIDGEGAANSGPDSSIPKRAKLDAISIASGEYAKSEWGERVYDPDYRKIEWK